MRKKDHGVFWRAVKSAEKKKLTFIKRGFHRRAILLVISLAIVEGSTRSFSTPVVNIVVLILKSPIKRWATRKEQSSGTFPPSCCCVRDSGFSISVQDGVCLPAISSRIAVCRSTA